MNKKRFLASFLSAAMVCSQIQGVVPNAFAANPFQRAGSAGTATGATPIGSASRNYRATHPNATAVIFGYSQYDDKGISFVEKLFNQQKMRADLIAPTIPNIVRNGLLYPGGAQLDDIRRLYQEGKYSEVDDHYFIQVGNTASENISYKELYRLLYSDRVDKEDLVNFLCCHYQFINKDFRQLLRKMGYRNAVCAAEQKFKNSCATSRPVEESSVTPAAPASPMALSLKPPVIPSVMSRVPGSGAPISTATYRTDRTDTLSIEEIDPKTNPEACCFMTKEQLNLGYRQKLRYMTQLNGQCATNMTGYGRGIAHIFAYTADVLNFNLLLANDRLRTRNVSIYEKEIPVEAVSPSEHQGGQFMYNQGPNVVEQLDELKRMGCQHLAVIDPANAHHPGGAPGGALTLEETICGESTLHTIIASSLFKPYYEKYNAGQYDPFNLAVAKDVFFYGSGILKKGCGLRQGVSPLAIINAPDFKLVPSAIFADVFVTAAPDKEQAKKDKTHLEPWRNPADGKTYNVLKEEYFIAWVKQQALAAKDLKIDGIVVTQIGTGSFKSFKPEWFKPGGLFETTWRKYAPDVHVIVFSTPDSCSATAADTQAYLEEFGRIFPHLTDTVALAKKDICRDADPLKKAVKDAVYGANPNCAIENVWVNLGCCSVNIGPIADHVIGGRGSTKLKNIAACYYGATAINSFVEDAINSQVIEKASGDNIAAKVEKAHDMNPEIMSGILWRNSNNIVWFNTGGADGPHYCFSEPWNTSVKPRNSFSGDTICEFKRFVEIDRYMCEATYDANSGWVIVKTPHGNEYYRVAGNQVQKWSGKDLKGQDVWRNVSFDTNFRLWQ